MMKFINFVAFGDYSESTTIHFKNNNYFNFNQLVFCCGMANCNWFFSDERRKEVIANANWILYPG